MSLLPTPVRIFTVVFQAFAVAAWIITIMGVVVSVGLAFNLV